MYRVITLISILIITALTNAQTKETEFKKQADSIIRAEFPRTRVFNFEYGQTLLRDFKSKLFDEEFQKGEITNQKTFNASANIPLIKTRKWSLTGSVNYKYNEFEFKDLENVSNTTIFEQNGIVNFHNISSSLSSTYFSTIFKKPVIYNASLIVDGNEKGFERIKGLIGASIIIKRTARTTITVGAIVFIDPTAQIPFFPTFTYNHKFKNSSWEFDFIMPQRILFRKPVSTKGRLSIGAEFGGNGFYVNVSQANFPDVFEYSQLEINSGLIYEHKLSNNVYATLKGGVTNFVSNRLTEKGQPTKDHIYENDQDITGYFKVGISFNPSFKKKRS
ncbi:hypothetical protein SAMN05428642_103241 [Flaviramulus basaltis]|uniref:Outer membrane protein beta-barrel domain-containing protein n=1 Tax=Flaviramulus basaltis TaxID=369401 RepID=A0A1K2IPK4_9FLAO|nr:DUF6268 family outer membrane beta-barrel protein [Flaviramulus basaltis]SFZ93627.1 hypothetical protein SAMN05428642_103241 [Flaviramulus basaltis]